MEKTASLFVSVEPEVKEQAESILNELGISMSNAVAMFLKQITLQKRMPFEVKLPSKNPVDISNLTEEEFDSEIEKGMEDLAKGHIYTLQEAKEIFHKRLAI